MTIVQPLSSFVVVTIRPFSSLDDDMARAVPWPSDRELEEEDDELTDELAEDEERERALAELDAPEGVERATAQLPLVPVLVIERTLRSARPPGKSRISTQLGRETLSCGGADEAADEARTSVIAVRRNMSVLSASGKKARPHRGRAHP